MNSDLRNVKVGDWIWTIQEGWVKVYTIGGVGYKVAFVNTKCFSYHAESGRMSYSDEAPSAFVIPPAEFNAGDPPCEFEDDERVEVSNVPHTGWVKRHFAYMKNGEYCCYDGGRDKWAASLQNITAWPFCRKWKEEEK